MLMGISGDPALGIAVVELCKTNVLLIVGLEALNRNVAHNGIKLSAFAERKRIAAGQKRQIVAAKGVGRCAIDRAGFVLHKDSGNQHIAVAVGDLPSHNARRSLALRFRRCLCRSRQIGFLLRTAKKESRA